MASFLALLGHALLFLLVFGMSATVDLAGVRRQLHNHRALGTGVALQFGVLPFLGFATVKALGLDLPVGLTLLVVTSSPGGSFSNWWCSIFNADLALSVTMTAISTLLAVVMLPLNLYVYVPLAFEGSSDVDVLQVLDFGALLTSLAVVISAVGLGIAASDAVAHPKFHLRANRLGSLAGVLLALLAGAASNATDGAALWQRDARFYVGVALPCLVALVLSNLVTTYSGLRKPERVTSSIECCYQNCGIATSVALGMFQGDDRAAAMGVPFLYGLVEFVLIGTYCLGAWRAGWTKAPPREPFWRVVTCSYEVLLSEWAAEGRDGVEVQLAGYDDCGVGIGELVKGASCLYYCHEPEAAGTGATPAAGAAAGDAGGDAPVDDEYVRVEDPAQAGSAAAEPETTANAAAKPEVAEDAYVALEDPEKGGGDSATGDVSKGDEWSLFWKSLGYKIRG